MKKLILTLALGAAVGVGLAVLVAVVWRALPTPPITVQQPPQAEVAATPPRRVSLPVFLALACTCNLSVVALLGSVALRRRMDSISPDIDAPPKKVKRPRPS